MNGTEGSLVGIGVGTMGGLLAVAFLLGGAILGAGLLFWANARARTRRDQLQAEQEAALSRLQLEAQQALQVSALKAQQAHQEALHQLQTSASATQAGLEAELAALRSTLSSTASRAAEQAQRLEHLQTELRQVSMHKSQLEEQLRGLQRESSDKIALLQEARESMTAQFSSLAQAILDEKSKKFTEQNQTNLSALLQPLGQRISEFRARVDEVYDKENLHRSALQQQVQQLYSLNQQLSSQAKGLTDALRGSKTQGLWGEMLLQRLLEQAGLREGQDFTQQESFMREDGSRAQPDVIINLPGNRQIIVDSKVSLTAYQAYAQAEDKATQDAALAAHLQSMRAHIRGLTAKAYEKIEGIQTLDCVALFIPIEPAFHLAITKDSGLFQEAWEKNVLLVSPSTLLFVLRTVAYLWRQEEQSQNVQQIVKAGEDLYDKFVGFVEDLSELGQRLQQAQTSHDKAMNKLTTGRGALTTRAEQLRKLGIKPKKGLKAVYLPDLGLPLGDEDGAEAEAETSKD